MSEVRQVFTGVKQQPLTTFFVAVSRGYKTREGRPAMDYIQVRAYGPPSNYISKYYKQYDVISIQGRVQVDKYVTKDGRKGFSFYVYVEKVASAGYSRDKVFRLYGYDVRKAEKELSAPENVVVHAEPEDDGSNANLDNLDW